MYEFLSTVCINIFVLILAAFLNITLQPSGFNHNTIGQRQYVICSVPISPNVDHDTIVLGWLSEEDIVTNDSRVTIYTSSGYFNDSTLFTVIQFDPLTQEDEGEYICYAVVNGSLIFESVNLQNFTST